MTFSECVLTLIQRPGYLGVLGTDKVICVGRTGFILDPTKRAPVYARIRAQDVMAVTWECWTPEQLESMAQSIAAEQPGGAIHNGRG